MNMPKIAILSGLALCILGVAGAIVSVMHQGNAVTALIPFFVGDAFVALGVFSLRLPDRRKHLMHALAALALLGIPAAVVPMAVRWNQASAMARTSMALMGLICAITLGLCIQSFMNARRARLLGDTPAQG